VRVAPRRAGRVDEADSGMARALRYGDNGEYLQPCGQREQKGDGRCHRRRVGVRGIE